MKFRIFILLFLLLCASSGFHVEPSRAKVYIFLSAKCPCAYSHQETVKTLEKKFSSRIEFEAVFVDKNDDAEEIEAMMKNIGWKMKAVKDQNMQLFKKYHPKVYTDCVLVSAAGNILYHGAIDDSPLNMGQLKNFYLQNAIEDFLDNRSVKIPEGKGAGCLIIK